MKNSMSIREKVLLCILGLLCVVMLYYYLFYIPTQAETQEYEAQFLEVDDEIIVADAKAGKLLQMKKELEAIKSGEAEKVKELPAYDNRNGLMIHLSSVLADTKNYNINFGVLNEDSVTMARHISLNYSCESYEDVKKILMKIYNGSYPCTFTNLYLVDEGKSITVDIIYYEYYK